MAACVVRAIVGGLPVFLAAIAIACGAGAAKAETTWEAYTYNPVATVAAVRGMARIIDETERATDGALKMKLHLGGSLQINATNITQAVADNIIQFADDGFFTGNIPVGGVMRLPMLIRTDEEYLKAARIVSGFMAKAYEKKGIVLLGDYTYPLQVPFTRKPLTSLAEFKGQKLRVTSPEQGEFLRRFGGSSVTMQPSEVPSSLDRGVIDGAFTASSGAGYVWRDLVKYNYRFGLNFVNAMIIVNKEAFDALTPDTQAKLRRIVAEVTPWTMATMQHEEAELTDKMAAGGVIVTQAKPEDLAEAQGKMEPYWNEWAKAHGPGAVEALKQIRAALGR
jgi:TRAP-type transport system periplasmic protein